MSPIFERKAYNDYDLQPNLHHKNTIKPNIISLWDMQII